MKNMKMILGIALFAATAVLALAQQYDAESDFDTELADGGKSILITDYVGTKQAVRIPPSIRGLPVTHIENNAFNGYETIVSITIPSV